MAITDLSQAVEKFATVTWGMSEADLERKWTWGDYDEGLRFAFFRTYEELRELAARLGTARLGSNHPLTTAQRILGQYHAAYRDLQAVLIGVTDDQADQAPAEGEWSVRRALDHIVRADRTFFTINLYALEGTRTGDGRPGEISEEAWGAFWAGDNFKQVSEEGSLASVLAYYAGLHQRVLGELASITEDELRTPSVFWEGTPMPVEFRLHRFDSHLKQHTIQIEKTLVAIGLGPSEAKRLLRIIYSALAEVEGVLIGADETGTEGCQALAAKIDQRADEVVGV